MKRKILTILLGMTLALSLVACGKDEAANAQAEQQVEQAEEPAIMVEKDEPEVVEEEPVEEEEPEEVREGFYRSELTNEWTDESIARQRPIAVMIDNEIKALPHYGTAQADVVYEMMNSTLNDRVTRFMCIFKDYNSISQIGSIRSVRTTNLQISPEYNSIVIHDGGPLYINAYFKAPYVEHLSGGFSRIDNGKPTEFTEYITEGQVTKRCEAEGIALEYNEYYQGPHWLFSKDAHPTDLSEREDSIDCKKIELPYEHNKSRLEYIEDEGVYRYSEYGQEYKDALTDEYMQFKNLIIQESTFTQFDEHGYMNFWIHENENMHGYFITNGKAIPITWAKNEYDMFPTQFYNAEGEMIKLNTGKTYVCIVPDDVWEQLVIE